MERFLTPENSALLLTTALFGATGLGVFGLVSMCFRVRARDLRHLGTASREQPVLQALRPVLERLAFIAGQIPHGEHRAWLRQKLQQANLIQQWSPELVETMKLFCAISAVVVGTLLSFLWGLGFPYLFLGLLAIISYFVPDMMIYSRAGERQDKMRKSLPFVIDLLAVSAEAGLAFQQSIRNVVTNSERIRDDDDDSGEQELLREFEHLLDALQMGRSVEDAMRDTSRRVCLDEFNVFANAVLQAERLGTPVSETLKNQSEELRAKLASRVEAKANQAPVKILFPLIIFIFPVTAWVIVGPVLLRVLVGQ